MKCPIYYAQLREQRNGSTSDRGECLLEECACFNRMTQNCDIHDMALTLIHIENYLLNIAQNASLHMRL